MGVQAAKKRRSRTGQSAFQTDPSESFAPIRNASLELGLIEDALGLGGGEIFRIDNQYKKETSPLYREQLYM